MLSVTQRVKTVTQPHGGYVPCSLFKTETYEDYEEVSDVRSDLASIQGLAVDYLTRFMITKDKFSAFDISLRGAKMLDDAYENDTETTRILLLLDQITGLDEKSVAAACKIVCYDSAFRAGIKAYQDYNSIDYSDELYHNVPILVNRSLAFFDSIGGIKATELSFEGGYTTMVSSGDGDYLSSNMLIDLKVSKKSLSIDWTLQLLMYYIMGIHSIHKEYGKIKFLCVFNPLKNQSYICDIKDISDEVKYVVSSDVLGYKMVSTPYRHNRQGELVSNHSTWKKVDGSNYKVLQSYLTSIFVSTGFKISNYDDGIHDITVDDYWTYLRSSSECKSFSKPMFRNIESVKLIKRSGYYMFIAVNKKGKYGLFQGAKTRILKYSPEYYYDFIVKYAEKVISTFAKYWDALEIVSKQIKSLRPTDEFLRGKYSEYLETAEFFGIPKKDRMSFVEWYSKSGDGYRPRGKIHGCIVDIDWYNHIYINPFDGTITPYFAFSMYDKDVYKNVRSLLADQKPEMLPAFDKLKIEDKKGTTALVAQDDKKTSISIISQDNEIDTKTTKVYDTEMYTVSNRLKPLQTTYYEKWVQVWYDDVLGENLQLEDRHFIKNKMKVATAHVGDTFPQKNGLDVTITRYGNYHDVDVSFEDGVVVEHTNMYKIRQGVIRNPNVVTPRKKREAKPRPVVEKPVEKKPSLKNKSKEKYLGLRKMMNCGLMATCIDYADCKNLTVRFEDGMIRTGIRSDHFISGKVGHEGGYYEKGQ